MLSSFEKLAAGALPAMYALFARANTIYTGPDQATVVTLAARVLRHESRTIEKNGREAEMQTGELLVLAADMENTDSGGAMGLKPVKGGRFSVLGENDPGSGGVGNEVWTISSMPVLKNGQWTCACMISASQRMGPRRAGGEHA